MAEAEGTDEIAQTSSPTECIDFKTKEEIFTDELVKQYKIPQYTIDESVTTTQIINAVDFVLKNAANPDASEDVMKVICSISLNESREQNFGQRIFDRAHLDEKWQEYLNEDYNRGYVILGAAPVKDKNLGAIKLTDLETKYNKVTSTAGGGGGGHEPAQEMWSPYCNNPHLYTSCIDSKYIHQYAGAWATYMLRAWVKKGKEMQKLIGETSSSTGGHCHTMIANMYLDILGIKPIPKMSLQAYKNLHHIMSKQNPYITGVFIRAATYMNCCAMNCRTQERMCLNGLVMNQVFDHALTTYSLCERVRNFLEEDPIVILNKLRKEDLTLQSCLDLLIFYYRYDLGKERYDKLKECIKSIVGGYVGGYYYRISRVINIKYNRSVGRQNNGPLVNALTTILVKFSTGEDLGGFVFAKGPKSKLGSEMGEAYVTEYRNNMERETSEWINRLMCAKDTA